MKKNFSVLLGAAFLMATSAIGPGFLTQTAVFTEQLKADFGFVILTSILLSFIAVSTIIFITIGRPVALLVIAGSLNGLILPITLGTILVASVNKKVVGDYKHPKWMLILGIIVVLITLYLGIQSLTGIKALFK